MLFMIRKLIFLLVGKIIKSPDVVLKALTIVGLVGKKFSEENL